jgi:hypothetical protein
MKGIKIEVENEKPVFLYRPYDMVDAISYAIYYTANPDSKMCVPNCAYEKAEKVFAEWRDGTREKKAVELLTKEQQPQNSSDCKNFLDDECIKHTDSCSKDNHEKCMTCKHFEKKENKSADK